MSQPQATSRTNDNTSGNSETPNSTKSATEGAKKAPAKKTKKPSRRQKSAAATKPAASAKTTSRTATATPSAKKSAEKKPAEKKPASTKSATAKPAKKAATASAPVEKPAKKTAQKKAESSKKVASKKAAPKKKAESTKTKDASKKSAAKEKSNGAGSKSVAELLESVASLGLPTPTPATVPAHRRRRGEFDTYSREVARGDVEVPPEMLTGRHRRLHVRDTVIEDHLLRMQLVPSAVSSKFADIARSPFPFFRGTAMLYYRDLAGSDAHLPFVPTVGDVHPENFGVLPGADGEPLFSINDMDEAWMAPFTWDLGRGAVGFALAAIEGGASRKKAMKVAKQFVAAYLDGVEKCVADPEEATRRVSGDDAPKVFRRYMKKAGRSRESFLRKRIDFDELNFRETNRVRRRPGLTPLIDDAVRRYSRRVRPSSAKDELPKDFFRIHDVAIRTGSGTASRGLSRFWVLVEGWGKSAEDKVILELKMSRHSVLDGLAPKQGSASASHDEFDPAKRIADAFDAFIIDGDPLYGYTDIEGVSFLVRERSPQKVNVDAGDFDSSELKKYAKLCGRMLARQHVRADRFLNGKKSDVAARILGAGHTNIFLFDTLELVAEQVDTVLRDHAMFAADHAAGAFAEIAEE
ncbi:DUF2252 family protein [Dietzia timorensis]|nr:DUF2252 family protein [Dietzia timorensis]